MFRNLFTRLGRIRRLEYLITSVLYSIIWFFFLLATETSGLEWVGLFIFLGEIQKGKEMKLTNEKMKN